MSIQNHHHSTCHGHKEANPSVVQTLDELDFERGVWSAAVDGEIGRVSKYLKQSGDPNAADSSGYAALHYAARNGHLDVCKLLMDYGANVNAQTRTGGATPLHRAAYKGHVDVIHLLLSKGALLSICDSDGMTSLHKAAENGNFEAFCMLKNKDPDVVYVKDRKGKTAIDYIPKDKHSLLGFKPDYDK